MFRQNNKWLTFLVVATGVFMSTLDSSMVNIALPTIMQEFNSSLNHTEWVVMIYLLTITSSLLFWGHLSDRFGRGKIYPAGMLTFGIGSLACAYAVNLPWLIGARFFQALGAAMMMSTGPAIIKETFPPEQLGRGLGLIGVSVSLGLMSGPTIGGFLIHYYSWRALFFVTIPFGFAFAILGKKLLPENNKVQSQKIDWPGGMMWAVSLTLAAIGLTHAATPSWSNLSLVIIFLASFIALLLFIGIETVTPHPLLHLRLFANRFFCMSITSAVLSFMTLFAVIILIPFYLDRVLNLPTSHIGIIMMAIPSTLFIVAPIAGWLSDHTEPRIIATLGLLISTVALFLLNGLQNISSPFEVATKLALLGCGQAMFLSPNSSSVLGRVKKEQAGTAASLLATARNLGMLLGIAQAGLVFSLNFSRLTNGLDMRDFTPAQTEPFMAALHSAFFVATLTGLLGVITSWLRGNNKHQIIKSESLHHSRHFEL